MKPRGSILRAVSCLGACLLWTGACFAQSQPSIQVLLLNGNNGTPLGNTGLIFDSQCRQGTLPECVRQFSMRWVWQKTDVAGMVELPISGILESITISRHAGDFKYCQDVGKNPNSAPDLPRFKIDDIVRNGVVAPNACNRHLHIQRKPGQLVFFLRPFTVWEEVTKPPQM